MAGISRLVAKITFLVVDVIFKGNVITSSVAKITYVVVEITLKWLWSLLKWPRSLLL